MDQDIQNSWSLLESIPDAVVIVDSQGDIRQANGATTLLFGYSLDELLKLKIEALLPERFWASHQRQRANFMQAPQTRAMGSGLELFGRHKDGHEIAVDIRLGPVTQGGEAMAIAIVRDISERKRAEELLRRAHDELENRVRERTDELARANQDLQGSLNRLTFLSNTSRALAEKSLDYENLLNLVARQFGEALGDICTIRLLADNKLTLEGISVKAVDGATLPMARSLVGAYSMAVDCHPLIKQVVQTGTTILINEPTADQISFLIPADQPAPEGAAHLHSLILAPLRQGGQVIGVANILGYSDKRPPFNQDDLKLIKDLADRAGLAITNAQYFRALEESRARMEVEIQQRTTELQQRTSMLELANDAIIIREFDSGTVKYWNKGAERLYGWTAQEVLGKSIHQFLKTVFPATFQEIRAYLVKNGSWEGELIHTCKDGRVITVASRWTADPSSTDEETDFLEINTDITESKRLEQERLQLEAQIKQSAVRAEALAELSGALAEIGLEDEPLFEVIVTRIANLIGDACILTLLSPDKQWLETKAFAHRDPEGLAYMKHNMPTAPYPIASGFLGRVARTGEASLVVDLIPAEIRNQVQPAYVGYVDRFGVASLLIVPLRARGQVIGTLGVSRDQQGPAYTTADQIYLQDIADRAGLAIENSRLYKDARRAQKEADDANLAKSEFLSRMSHELRTPLNAVLGFAQLLEIDNLQPRQAENVGQILSAGRHLLGLINEVLDLTRIETGKFSMSPEAVAVNEVIAEALDMVHPLSIERQVTLENGITEEEFAKCDRQRLKQVMLNLLTNAVKYNYQGGKVWVRTSIQPSNTLRIEVIDTGRGIAPDKMKRLFTPFDRLGAEQGEVEGTGLGLALSQRLVEAMQGTIGAESDPNKGSTFWVQLPHTVSPTMAVQKAQPGVLDAMPQLGAAPYPKYTVLYIEDNLSNLKLIEQIFSLRPQIKLVTRATGEGGLTAVEREQPDLILLDLNLPDISGLEVLQRLQAGSNSHWIPVVVVSADVTPRQIKHLREAGARDYVGKPLNVVEFLKVVDAILE